MDAILRFAAAASLLAGAVGTTGAASSPPTVAPAPVDVGAVVHYRPPVDAAIVDPFRPPANPYAAGNRGLDYGVAPGARVGAAAAGVVTFAGRVGGSLAVTVLHADRISTTYTGLASLAVAEGDAVAAGALMGTTSAAFHFGVRAGAAYLDPAVLLEDRPAGRIRLVPVTVR